ncbi:hypothetical protein [Propionibacterium freudenreichii]|uniref:hypothetical protein n=1 Tax=Propionibacterium freudenreichii TaxID=1744 RepID=UPI000541E225|nr:hypothetical protein [Propionibacterium freudenreichii]CEG94923.1 Protein of unknown function [Propionibacterium freudenreichii]
MTSIPAHRPTRRISLADAINLAMLLGIAPLPQWLTPFLGRPAALVVSGLLAGVVLTLLLKRPRSTAPELTPAESAARAAADIQVATCIFDGFLDGGVHRTALAGRTDDAETREALRQLPVRAQVPKDIFDPDLENSARGATDHAWYYAIALDELEALGPVQRFHPFQAEDPILREQRQRRRALEDEAGKARGLLLWHLRCMDRRLHLLGTRAATSK